MRLHYDKKVGVFYDPLSPTGDTFSGEQVAELIGDEIGYLTTFLSPVDKVIVFKVSLPGWGNRSVNLTALEYQINLVCGLNSDCAISFLPSVDNGGFYWFSFTYDNRS
jgi:hypothetical protein